MVPFPDATVHYRNCASIQPCAQAQGVLEGVFKQDLLLYLDNTEAEYIPEQWKLDSHEEVDQARELLEELRSVYGTQLNLLPSYTELENALRDTHEKIVTSSAAQQPSEINQALEHIKNLHTQLEAERQTISGDTTDPYTTESVFAQTAEVIKGYRSRIDTVNEKSAPEFLSSIPEYQQLQNSLKKLQSYTERPVPEPEKQIIIDLLQKEQTTIEALLPKVEAVVEERYQAYRAQFGDVEDVLASTLPKKEAFSKPKNKRAGWWNTDESGKPARSPEPDPSSTPSPDDGDPSSTGPGGDATKSPDATPDPTTPPEGDSPTKTEAAPPALRLLGLDIPAPSDKQKFIGFDVRDELRKHISRSIDLTTTGNWREKRRFKKLSSKQKQALHDMRTLLEMDNLQNGISAETLQELKRLAAGNDLEESLLATTVKNSDTAKTKPKNDKESKQSLWSRLQFWNKNKTKEPEIDPEQAKAQSGRDDPTTDADQNTERHGLLSRVRRVGAREDSVSDSAATKSQPATADSTSRPAPKSTPDTEPTTTTSDSRTEENKEDSTPKQSTGPDSNQTEIPDAKTPDHEPIKPDQTSGAESAKSEDAPANHERSKNTLTLTQETRLADVILPNTDSSLKEKLQAQAYLKLAEKTREEILSDLQKVLLDDDENGKLLRKQFLGSENKPKVDQETKQIILQPGTNLNLETLNFVIDVTVEALRKQQKAATTPPSPPPSQ